MGAYRCVKRCSTMFEPWAGCPSAKFDTSDPAPTGKENKKKLCRLLRLHQRTKRRRKSSFRNDGAVEASCSVHWCGMVKTVVILCDCHLVFKKYQTQTTSKFTYSILVDQAGRLLDSSTVWLSRRLVTCLIDRSVDDPLCHRFQLITPGIGDRHWSDEGKEKLTSSQLSHSFPQKWSPNFRFLSNPNSGMIGFCPSTHPFMGLVRIHHRSHGSFTNPTHSVGRARQQANMAAIEF